VKTSGENKVNTWPALFCFWQFVSEWGFYHC